MRDNRRLGIVEDNTFLSVKPAWSLVDPGKNAAKAERQDFVSQETFLRIENFALPSEVIDELGEVNRIGRTGSEIPVPFPSPFGMSPAGLFVKSPSS
jgi:hypothetical protein